MGRKITNLKVSTEEIKALLQCKPEVRYQYTLKRIADTERMWTVVGSKAPFAVLNYEDKRLLPVWSSKEYAQAFCINDRAKFKSIAITLNNFEEYVIDFICNEELLINVFPTEKEPIGKIVSLNKFAEDLSILSLLSG